MLNIHAIRTFDGTELVQTLEAKPGRWICRVLGYVFDNDQVQQEYEAEAALFGGPPDDMIYEAYSTEAAALKALQLHAEYSLICSDLHAFGAPGECGREAFKKIEQQQVWLESDFYVETIVIA